VIDGRRSGLTAARLPRPNGTRQTRQRQNGFFALIALTDQDKHPKGISFFEAETDASDTNKIAFFEH